jgi:hypothetical protein
MMMLTKANRAALPPLYSQDGKGDEAMAFVKFFTPWSNWTWYATEGQPILNEEGSEVDFEFFGYVVGLDKELGYFRLKELTEVRGMFGLKIERDRYFRPTSLKVIKEKGWA